MNSNRPRLELPRWRRHAPDWFELAPKLVIKRMTVRDLKRPSLLTAVAALRQEWERRGFPELPTLEERLNLHLVFSAWHPVPMGPPMLAALLSGICAVEPTPRWDELLRDPPGLHGGRSVNFYEIIVDPRFRRWNAGLTLFQHATAFCRQLVPGVGIRTISPIHGFRLWLGHVLGLDDLTRALAGTYDSPSKRLQRATPGVIEAARTAIAVAEAAADHRVLRDSIEGRARLGDWLRAVCREPAVLQAHWQRSTGAVRADIERLLIVLARRYCRETWCEAPDDGDSRQDRLVCPVSHFHLRQGAEEERYDAFARDDPDSLFMTISFRYPDEDTRTTNAAAFERQRIEVTARRRGLTRR